MVDRRQFVSGLLGVGAYSLALQGRAAEGPAAPAAVHEAFPSQDPVLVREIVGASHARLERVQELVEASPALAKAAWDWGFGDWETALGAASHTGRRDIADVLIAHGARPDLFTFAMLGQLDVVKTFIAANPGIQSIPGPHGITLLQHARNGGEPANAVAAYLETLGDADVRATSLEVSAALQALYVGLYRFAPGDVGTLDVLVDSKGRLAIKRGERSPHVLNRVEAHGFAPNGAPEVRIRFDVGDGKASRLTIHDPHPIVTALRVEDVSSGIAAPEPRK
jgi:hypothetical protein